jgi:hypothetical protein
VGATIAAAEFQQQQHASLTFFNQKNTEKNPKKAELSLGSQQLHQCSECVAQKKEIG